MILLLLVLAPLKIGVGLCLSLNDGCLLAKVRLWGIKIFDEKLVLQGRYLVCSGSVEATFDVLSMDGTSGKSLLSAPVWDSVSVTFALDYTKCSPMVLPAVEGVLGAVTALLCAATHCNVHSQSCFSQQNAVFCNVWLSVSLAEILIVLLQNSLRVRRKKHHKI